MSFIPFSFGDKEDKYEDSIGTESRTSDAPTELTSEQESLSIELDSRDNFDVGMTVGKGLIEGAAMNSNITLEQKLSLKAMEALINHMVAPPTQPDTLMGTDAFTTSQQSQVQAGADLLA